MNLPRFPHPQINMGPRCSSCLQNVPSRKYVPSDECSEACLEVEYGLMRTIGEPPPSWGHLHWECDCGFKWATMTALQSGHDPEKQ